ncbi:MAG: hypothetical protein ISS19_04575 [Bacteroidales bacterium]|nr:hypothetical protein [Bacteroidales bacterium]
MKRKSFLIFLLTFAINPIITDFTLKAQVSDSKPAGDRKLEKETGQLLAFSRIDSLVNSRQFVFQAEYNQGSDMVFVVVDSLFGEVQNGNRNNLQGQITHCEVKKNEKKKNLTVSIKMRGEIYTADAFLFIDSYGNGKATVKSEFPGNFSFFGRVVEFENASIYEGPSHFVH